ncbi:hypothetical protein F2Q70_00012884 [Brassica cretica]|uniref:ABC transmembrane type-1 domain-containing protein n=1 Tax=Brassica cretica TaxID=69181 RepID=A0A8S9M8D2_BRACR|nr:hypothetical protein F2Q70_00012884 [Brassica cretica]
MEQIIFRDVVSTGNTIDADQRLTRDLEKLTTDLSGLLTGMVKLSVDILTFTWRMKLLTGQFVLVLARKEAMHDHFIE